MKDYTDKILSEGHFLRKFHSDYSGMELDWHRDYNDRTIRVIKGRGWKCQIDDQLPRPMHEGQFIKIPARTFHRLFSGYGPLIIEVVEGKKKKKLSPKQKKIARAAPPEDEITGADFKALNRNEGTKLDDPDYETGRSEKEKKKLAKAVAAYKKAKKTPGKADDMRAIKMRNAVAESRTIRVDPDILREYIEEIVEAQKLAIALEEVAEIEEAREDALWEYSENDTAEELEEKRRRRRRKSRRKKRKSSKSGRTLSKAVKKSLDKKADRRCLTRGSVYAEFRAGLGAYYTSGSRKGMSPHQWAHARVNSANPSKSWAKVKKRKKCPKKKK